MPLPLQVAFVAGLSGMWHIERITAVAGESLPPAERLAVIEGPEAQRPLKGSWILRGTTSNARYTNREELKALSVKQEMLLRPQATRAALIPIRKTAAWWDLAQDERRVIFEGQSRHIGIGMEYLPAVARRLHHSRELGAIRLPDLVRVRPRTRRCLRGVGPPTAQHGGVAVRRAGSRYPREPITGRLLFRIAPKQECPLWVTRGHSGPRRLPF